MANYDASSINKSKRSNKIYKDLDLDFTRNPVTHDISTIEDVDAVKRSVRNLVQTNFYERPFQPELGCGIRGLLFENYSPIIGIFLKRKIAEVITRYEPRVSLQDISLDDEPDKNRLKLSLYFYVQNISDPVTVETFLQRLR
jgi:phage baseplate assembly protein W|tara:strand:+ start:297 stop:722 length:426 start_codon:yes stop_codon:yes gene_type:complete